MQARIIQNKIPDSVYHSFYISPNPNGNNPNLRIFLRAKVLVAGRMADDQQSTKMQVTL